MLVEDEAVSEEGRVDMEGIPTKLRALLARGTQKSIRPTDNFGGTEGAEVVYDFGIQAT